MGRTVVQKNAAPKLRPVTSKFSPTLVAVGNSSVPPEPVTTSIAHVKHAT
jgi:hypothetical protein